MELNTTNFILKSIFNYNVSVNFTIREGLLPGTYFVPEAGLAVSIVLLLISIYIYVRFRKQKRNRYAFEFVDTGGKDEE